MAGRNLGATPTKNTKRTLRYVVVKPDRVFNWLGMMNVTAWAFFPELRNTWWFEETVKVREKIQQLYIEKFDKIAGHFTRLEQSMLKDGFHAPVNTITGPPRGMFLQDVLPIKTLPPIMQTDPNKALVTHTFGGSRVIIAQKHGMDIPCFVYDFTNTFPNAEELKTQQQVRSKFPNTYSIGPVNSQVVVRAIVHSHMPNSRNDGQERNNRHKIIEKIRQELKRDGVL